MGRFTKKKKNKGQQRPPIYKKFQQIVTKYQQLVDAHLQARSRYFDLFYRSGDKGREKLERQFSSTMKDVRNFENNVPPKFKEAFLRKINVGSLDQTYSQNHGLVDKEASRPPKETPVRDPHFLKSQELADYKDDTEESTGTFEDYKKLKGLV